MSLDFLYGRFGMKHEEFKKSKKKFIESFKKRMEELGISGPKFCERMAVSENRDDETAPISEYEKFKQNLRCDNNRYIPIKYVSIMEKELGKKYQKEREICNELRCLWESLEEYGDRDKFKPFLAINDDDLFWITNNLEELLQIPQKNINFLRYLFSLNEQGKYRLLNDIAYAMNTLELNVNDKEFFKMRFVEKDAYKIKDRVDCLLEIENIEKDNIYIFWKTNSPETRSTIVDTWKDYRQMDDLDKKIYSLFTSYNNEKPLDISDQQVVIMTIIVLLLRNQKYRKIAGE